MILPKAPAGIALIWPDYVKLPEHEDKSLMKAVMQDWAVGFFARLHMDILGWQGQGGDTETRVVNQQNATLLAL